MAFRLFSNFDDVADARAGSAAEFRVLASQMRDAVHSGAYPWSTYETFVEYASVCLWAMRTLEYGFASESFRSVEPPERALRVLDVGCGVVPFASWVSRRGHNVVAVDPLAADIEAMVGGDLNSFYGSNVHYLTCLGEQLPFASNSFDVVTCVSVLEHVAPGNDRLTIWEMARVLKPGGHLIITFDVGPDRQLDEGEVERPAEFRPYRSPFTAASAARLFRDMNRCFDLDPNDPVLSKIKALDFRTVHEFWGRARDYDGRSGPPRNYLSIGTVTKRRARIPQVSSDEAIEAYGEGQVAIADQLTFFELHAAKRLEKIQALTDVADRRLTLIEDQRSLLISLESTARERLRLINEQRTSLASLEAVAQERLELSNELRESLGRMSEELTARADDLEERERLINRLSSEAEALRFSANKLSADVAAKELEIARKEAALKTLHEDLTSKELEIARKEAALKALHEESAEVQRTFASTVSDLQQQVADLRAALAH